MVLLGEQAVGRLLGDASWDTSRDVSWGSSPTCLAGVSPSSVFSWVTLNVSVACVCVFPVQVLYTWARLVVDQRMVDAA